MTTRTFWNDAGEIVVNTRAEALARFAPRSGTVNARILAYLRRRAAFGGTMEEITEQCLVKTSTVCGANDSLRKAGLVRDSGQVRKARSGCRVIVWTATAPPDQIPF
jgi:hypothetical protein